MKTEKASFMPSPQGAAKGPPIHALLILNDPPYGTERVHDGLRLTAGRLKRTENRVTAFLADAAVAAKAEDAGWLLRCRAHDPRGNPTRRPSQRQRAPRGVRGALLRPKTGQDHFSLLKDVSKESDAT